GVVVIFAFAPFASWVSKVCPPSFLFGNRRWWARRRCAFAHPAASLRQQRERPVPVLRRRILLVTPDPRLIEIVEQFERMSLVGLAATLDCLQRAGPVASTVAGQHLDGQVAQALEAAGLRGVLAARDGVDHLGLLLALDH